LVKRIVALYVPAARLLAAALTVKFTVVDVEPVDPDDDETESQLGTPEIW
jgi:hypothetical protein